MQLQLQVAVPPKSESGSPNIVPQSAQDIYKRKYKIKKGIPIQTKTKKPNQSIANKKKNQ